MSDLDDFDIFYKEYPRKIAKGEARKAWAQTKSIRPPLAKIIEAIQAQCTTEQWLKDNHVFIPHPATWLRAERWDDEIKVVIKGVVKGKDWWETWSGIKAKGAEFGLVQESYEHPMLFKSAVFEKAKEQQNAQSNVIQLKQA